MNHKQRKILAELPSNGQEWVCHLFRASGWADLDDPKGKPWRPVLCFVVDRLRNVVVHFGAGKRGESPAQVASRVLFEGMTTEGLHHDSDVSDPLEAGTPGRPASIEFSYKAVQQALQDDLDALGIQHSRASHWEFAGTMQRKLAEVSGQPVDDGIMLLLEYDDDKARSFFAAAAEFHRAMPWRIVNRKHVIEVRYPPTAEPFWVRNVDDGNVAGIMIFDSLDTVNRIVTSDGSSTKSIPYDVTSFGFALPHYGASCEDLDAIEKLGLAVDGEDGFPMLFRARVDGGDFNRQPASLRDLERVTALMQVLPEFMSSDVHMAAQEDEYPKPADATLMLSAGDPHGSIRLTFPPAGITFRPPMYGDPREDDFDLDDLDLDEVELRAFDKMLADLESLKEQLATPAVVNPRPLPRANPPPPKPPKRHKATKRGNNAKHFKRGKRR